MKGQQMGMLCQPPWSQVCVQGQTLPPPAGKLWYHMDDTISLLCKSLRFRLRLKVKVKHITIITRFRNTSRNLISVNAILSNICYMNKYVCEIQIDHFFTQHWYFKPFNPRFVRKTMFSLELYMKIRLNDWIQILLYMPGQGWTVTITPRTLHLSKWNWQTLNKLLQLRSPNLNDIHQKHLLN